jgi:hypothetical protein
VVSDLFFNLFTLLNNILAKLNFILFRFQFCFHLQSILGMFIQLLNPEAALLQYPLRVNQSASSYFKIIFKCWIRKSRSSLRSMQLLSQVLIFRSWILIIWISFGCLITVN